MNFSFAGHFKQTNSIYFVKNNKPDKDELTEQKCLQWNLLWCMVFALGKHHILRRDERAPRLLNLFVLSCLYRSIQTL